MQSFPRLLQACALGALCAAVATATTLRPIQATETIDLAELILVGQIVAIDSATSGDGNFPFTFVTVTIDEVLKGQSAQDELTLRFLGGDLPEAEETVEVLGMPRFELGSEVLLFVQGNGKLACPLVGWNQGKLDIVRHPATGERLVVDHRGVPIEGLDQGGWLYGDARYDAETQSFVEREAKFEVLWQDGVVIEDEPSDRQAAYKGRTAESVLEILRRSVDERRRYKSFQRGLVVHSADPFDLPESVQFTAVAPR